MIIYFCVLVIVNNLVAATQLLSEDVPNLPKIECRYLSAGRGLSCYTKTNIELNETHPHFRFKNKFNTVDQVRFLDLTMHTFTNDTCFEFPTINYLYASGIELQVLLQNALELCRELVTVSFSDNQLLRLSSWTFIQNQKLMSISLENNSISIIEDHAFENLGNLEWLDMSDLQLKLFPSEGQLDELPKLRNLLLTSDYLEAIDGEEIFKKCPSLKSIEFYENNFMSMQYIEEHLRLS